VPCSLPRRTERVHVSMPSPFAQAFPGKTAGRRSHLDFRGLLKLHSRYGPLACSAAQGGLCHEASIPPVAQQNRSSATRAIDNSLRGTFLHWRCAPSGRTDYGDTCIFPPFSRAPASEGARRAPRRSVIDCLEAIMREGNLNSIGIGGSLAAPPLPHRRTYGSVYGGSAD